MFQNPLFIMSLSGTIVFILYILIYPLAKRYFSLKWRYLMLKIAIVFYLVPFPKYKYLIMNVIHRLFPNLWEVMKPDLNNIEMKYAIAINHNIVQFSLKLRYMLLVILAIVIVSLVILLKQLFQYWKLKRIYFTNIKNPVSEEQKLFIKIKKEMDIKKNVKLICSEYCKSPMTYGIISYNIIVPVCSECKMEEYEYILKHELVHIKHQDLLVKYIGLLVMAVHWFNPFAYFLFHEISIISEMYCDSVVICGKGEKERKKYGDLLLRLAIEQESIDKGQYFVGIANSRNKKNYKRRILEMKRNNKHKVILSAIVMTFICMIGGVTIFAYDPPKIVSGDPEYDVNADINVTIETTDTELVDLPSDCFFVDDYGNVYDISNQGKNSKINCFHDFSIHGTYTNHKKDGSGCIVKSYEALICSICSHVKLGKLKSTVTYNPCPH